MASLPVIRAALLVSFSVLVTVVLGFGLPALLNAVMAMLGLPQTSAAECIVVLYLLFVLYIATPRIPRGLVEVMMIAMCTVILNRELNCPLYKM